MNHFCDKCFTPYNNHPKQKHSCFATCQKCGSTECPMQKVKLTKITCNACHVEFASQFCYDQHMRELCSKFWQCPDCKRYLARRVCSPEDHKCGTYLCHICKCWVNNDHLCYQKKETMKKPVEKMIFFMLNVVKKPESTSLT